MTDATNSTGDSFHDIRDRLRQLTQPIVDSLDSRLRKQVDDRLGQLLEPVADVVE